jgi:hypothetical protein
MIVRITIRHQERDEALFAPGCFNKAIGKAVPFRAGDVVLPSTLVAAEIVDGGRAVLLTLDIQDVGEKQ